MTSLEGSPEPIDPAFVFDFRPYDDPDHATQRWTTWWSVEPLCRGPEPRPEWVVTDRAAVDTELGVLKTGKEADVFLVERAVPDRPEPGVVMAAKRYRDADHRSFRRHDTYTAGRRGKDSREARAAARGTAFGRTVAAAQWAGAEWAALTRCWQLGLPVPYPVQLDGTELLLEWVSHDGDTAPRLAETRPDPPLLRDLFEQLREALARLTQHGLVHGDLSAYNLLVAGERLVLIDLPQTVDLVGNPLGFDFLLRDCTHVCAWFRARGLDPAIADEHAVYADLLATAF